MKLSRETLATLAGWTDDQKADVLALFDTVKAKDDEISRLKTVTASDSQQIVDKVEFSKLMQAQTERDQLAQKLREKLDSANVETETDPLEAFSAITSLFKFN
jgi:hypothetical protein